MAIETSGIFNGRKVGNIDTAEIRNRTLLKWQEQEVWDTSYTDHWMHRLIWDVKQWVLRKFEDSNFHITLMLTSHGCFSEYLHKFKKLNDPKCVDSVANSNDDEHTLFQCDRWWRHRREFEVTLGSLIEAETIVCRPVVYARDDGGIERS